MTVRHPAMTIDGLRADIVQKLREAALDADDRPAELCLEAASEIERLKEQVRGLQEEIISHVLASAELDNGHSPRA